MAETLTDFPKIYCPFIRQTFKVDSGQFNAHGSKYGLRMSEVYLAVDRINTGYEWVFEDPETIAVEKLNGTNIKIRTEQGRLVAFQNRKNLIGISTTGASGSRIICFPGLSPRKRRWALKRQRSLPKAWYSTISSGSPRARPGWRSCAGTCSPGFVNRIFPVFPFIFSDVMPFLKSILLILLWSISNHPSSNPIIHQSIPTGSHGRPLPAGIR